MNSSGQYSEQEKRRGCGDVVTGAYYATFPPHQWTCPARGWQISSRGTTRTPSSLSSLTPVSPQSSLWLLIQKMRTRSVNPSFSKQRRAEEIRNLRTLLLSVKKVGVCRWLNMSYPFILEVKNKTIITSFITFNWLK